MRCDGRSPRWARVIALAALAAPLAACEGELTLELVQAGFEDLYPSVKALKVRVLSPDYAVLEEFGAAFGGAITLGTAQPGAGRRVHVVGFDAVGEVAGHGYSRARDFGKSLSAAEIVPFGAPSTVVAVPLARAVSGTPVVDGALGEWIAPPSLVLDDGHRVSGPQRGRADLRAELMIAWGYDRLYFAVAVRDRCTTLAADRVVTCKPSAPDRIAFGFDGADDGGDYGPGDLFVAVDAKGVRVLAGSRLQPEQLPLAFGVLPNGAGWAVEGAVTLAALGRSTISPSDRVGLELAVIAEHPDEAEPTILRLSQQPGPPDQLTPVEAMRTLGFGRP